jgi:hypothetical protein
MPPKCILGLKHLKYMLLSGRHKRGALHAEIFTRGTFVVCLWFEGAYNKEHTTSLLFS